MDPFAKELNRISHICFPIPPRTVPQRESKMSVPVLSEHTGAGNPPEIQYMIYLPRVDRSCGIFPTVALPIPSEKKKNIFQQACQYSPRPCNKSAIELSMTIKTFAKGLLY
jgi:hypothetical protein